MGKIVAQGNQICLRAFEDSLTDDEIARIYHWSANPEVLRWSGGAPTDLTLGEFRERLLNERESPWDTRLLFLILTHDGALIGRIGIFGIDWQKRNGELGIAIGEPSLWGQGYGRDAVTTLLRHVFDTTTLDRINLYTFVENVRAQRCFAACGFRILDTARRFSLDIGDYTGIEMEITRGEFAKLDEGVRVGVLHSPRITLTQDAK